MRPSAFLLMDSRIDIIIRNLFLCKFRVDKRAIPTILLGVVFTLLLWPFQLAEFIYYKIKTRKTKVKPVFIVGHWRSGTTMLQYILAKDGNLSYFDTLSAYCVNTVVWKPLLRKVLPPILIRAFDNMEYNLVYPWEDSVCFTEYCSYSNWSRHMFPQDRERYLDYAVVDELPTKIQAKWFRAYDNMIRKFYVQSGNGRPMVFKGPDATARTLFLSKKYPDAVFLNVYRSPYAVIRSTINMYKFTTTYFSLQALPTEQEEEEFIIHQFKRIYTKYFEDIKSIPADRIIELRFEDLEKDPMPMLEEAYKRFGWDWESAKEPLRTYWDSLSGYQKNVFDYSPRLIRRVNEELGFYFEHYGYEMLPVPDAPFEQ